MIDLDFLTTDDLISALSKRFPVWILIRSPVPGEQTDCAAIVQSSIVDPARIALALTATCVELQKKIVEDMGE